MKSEQTELVPQDTPLKLAKRPPQGLAPAPEPTTGQMLAKVLDGGLTMENVAVAKELIAMRREEVALQNKVAFNAAFFQLKKEISGMDFYADKAAKDRNGNLLYTYCSESEITAKLEPLLLKHGFTMLFGQRQENERVVAAITLIHEQGHEEVREYAVRMGATNAAKDATQADTGSTTSAWRHLVIKLFGIRSRITEEADPHNIGAPISHEQAQTLREMIKETNSDEKKFLAFAQAESVEAIGTNDYDRCFRALAAKRRQ